MNNIKWIDPIKENVRFYGLKDILNDNKYYRLSLKELETINHLPKIINLSKCAAGGQIHFMTNSRSLHLKLKINSCFNLSGMSYLAQAGMDVYVGNNYDDLLFYDSFRTPIFTKDFESLVLNEATKKERLIIINLPLLSEIIDLQIGLDEDAYIKKPSVDLSDNQKIVYYGTSITQGVSASRPGLCFTNQLSRLLKGEILNFGFSGNAFGEAEIAKILSDIQDVSMFVLDYEANAGTNGKLEKTLETFIQIIRAKYPKVPIVVVSRIKYLFDDLNYQTLGKRRKQIRNFQKNLVKTLIQQGDRHLYFIDGSKLLGKKYDEYTVDSVHPNDLGMEKITTGLFNKLKKIISEDKEDD